VRSSAAWAVLVGVVVSGVVVDWVEALTVMPVPAAEYGMSPDLVVVHVDDVTSEKESTGFGISRSHLFAIRPNCATAPNVDSLIVLKVPRFAGYDFHSVHVSDVRNRHQDILTDVFQMKNGLHDSRVSVPNVRKDEFNFDRPAVKIGFDKRFSQDDFGIPGWKRLQELPSEFDELKARVNGLEGKLGAKWPPDVCRFCGERAVRLARSVGPDAKHHIQEYWECSECRKEDIRLVKAR
jgi:hypothetical protein